MDAQLIFDFKTDISKVAISSTFNNPFGSFIPEIANIATKEFQEFISAESLSWKYDFDIQKGKMFGVLVIQKQDNSYGYLGTISGKLSLNETCEQFVPSIFNDSIDDFIYMINQRKQASFKVFALGDPLQTNSSANRGTVSRN